MAAEKNISVSRIAAGAVRLHPTAVATGEAVGALAALALRREVLPDAVVSPAVQISLLRGGALLSPVRISNLSPDDERFVPVCLAVCRRLVDWRYVRSTEDSTEEPWVEVDLDRAEAAGRALLEVYSDWDCNDALRKSEYVGT